MYNKANELPNATAIGIWENEGDALGEYASPEQYGRRIEADRSWTVYHVFTGVPARPDGQAMTGLNWSDATDRMQALNLRNEGLRGDRPEFRTQKHPLPSAIGD